MELNEATKKISPEEYNTHLSHIDIHDSYLRRLQCVSGFRNWTGEVTFSFKETIGQVNVVEERAKVDISYELQILAPEGAVLDLSAEYTLQYVVQGVLPEEFYVIFKNYTVPLQSFPYFRELVHSMTSRMGFPPLILPLRKYLTALCSPKLAASVWM
jgi:preprotein translocase subunit SecB